jgi:hypothetical protein
LEKEGFGVRNGSEIKTETKPKALAESEGFFMKSVSESASNYLDSDSGSL